MSSQHSKDENQLMKNQQSPAAAAAAVRELMCRMEAISTTSGDRSG